MAYTSFIPTGPYETPQGFAPVTLSTGGSGYKSPEGTYYYRSSGGLQLLQGASEMGAPTNQIVAPTTVAGKTPDEIFYAPVTNPQAPAPAGPIQGQQNIATSAPTSNYTGPSIVDYLRSTGQPSDFASRSQLAAQQGIQGYVGTPEQNTQLLNNLRTQANQPTASSQAPPSAITAVTPYRSPYQQQIINPPDQTANNQQANLPELPSYDKLLADFSNTYNQSQNFDNIYQRVYNNLGLDSVKRNIDSLSEKLGAVDKEAANEIAKINDNPWLSEGLRSSKITAYNQKAQGERNALINELQLQQSVFDRGRQDAQFGAQQIYQQLGRQQDIQKDLFFNRVSALEKETEARRKLLEFNPSNFKEVQGGLFNVQTGKFIVPPSGGSDLVSPIKEYLQALELGLISPTVDFLHYQQQKAFSNPSFLLQTGALDRALTPDEAQKIGVPIGTRLSEVQGRSTFSQDQKDILQQFDNASTILKQVDEVTSRINKYSGLHARINGLIRLGKSYAGYDDDIAALDALNPQIVTLVRSLGDKGNIPQTLIEQTIKSIKALPTDTVGEAKQKTAGVKEFFIKARQNYLNLAGQGQQANISSVGSIKSVNFISKKGKSLKIKYAY